jgi:hypothetical protein
MVTEDRKAARRLRHETSPVAQNKELVARVLASAQFQKTARLRAFLDYVCSRYFDDPNVRITEEELAAHVFDRLLDGHSDDTIVRVSASQLRKRLENYFAGPGIDEEVVLEISKGSYTPVFR